MSTTPQNESGCSLIELSLCTGNGHGRPLISGRNPALTLSFRAEPAVAVLLVRQTRARTHEVRAKFGGIG
jgi:hypothetical protein